jgi:type V secretory pathway adhesin AidA
MTIIKETSVQATTVGADEVENYHGVVIGRVLASGVVIDHRGVHIGQVTVDGDVVDHGGRRMGRVGPSADVHGRSAPEIRGAGGTP